MKTTQKTTQNKNRHLLLSVLLLGTLALGFTAGAWMPRDDEFFALRKNFQIFGKLYEELVTGYVDPLDAQKLMRTGIDAMLEDLDPYTVFIDEAANADIDIITRGRYGGVGLNVGMRDGKITVTSPVEGASGYLRGVRAGDIITHIAKQSTEGLSINDVQNLLRGEPGTAVEITVEREGEPEPIDFLLTREEVKLKNVVYSGFVGADSVQGIGYVKLERFAREAAAEVRKAITDLQAQGELNGLILDLRDNPGGLLDAAVEITQLFVPQGSMIVSTRGRQPQSEHAYRGKTPPLVPDLPLVVLVSAYSASASEIVAGALQDLDRAVILGVPTFGKGLVQIIKPLPYNTSLKLTTSQYFIPSGRSIQAIDYGSHDGNFSAIPDSLRRAFKTQAGRTVMGGRGIEPDVDVELGDQSELEQSLQRRASFFFFANHYAATHPTIPQDFEVTDEVFSEFKAWLEDQSFSYRTAAERSAEMLSSSLASIGYEEAQDEMEALRTAIMEEKGDDFERHRDRLRERIRTEILARYFGESAQIETSLGHDPQFSEAMRLLQAPDAYAAVLRP